MIAGAVGSLGLLLRAGAGAPPILLVLFVGWVLSPYLALILAHRVSVGWTARTRLSLYAVMLIVTVVSLAVYAIVVLGQPASRHTAVFLIVPLASWLIAAIAVTMTALRSRRSR